MKTCTIITEDGLTLAANWFECTASKTCLGTVVINPATGVSQRFYGKYSAFLSEHHYNVLTYDYRGIGASRPAHLRGFQASFTDWGQKDYAAALGYARKRSGNGSLFVIGHSVGGFITGMTEETSACQGVITIAAQMAYYKDWATPRKYWLYFLWHIIIPLVTKLYGYFPGKKWRLMEDIPAGVVRQWHGRRKEPDMSKQLQREGARLYYEQISTKILHVGFTDDPIGTPRAIQRMAALFRRATAEIKIISPADAGTDHIGHFGFFRKAYEETLWHASLEWLRSFGNQRLPLPE